jgi:serine/threonine-protein kinase
MTQARPDDPLPSPNDQPTVIQEHDQVSLRASPAVTPVPGAAEEPPLFTLNDDPSPLPLSRVGEYEILSTVGRGGMGIVFKARHVRLSRVVALKMLSAGLLARPEDIHRFENEAAAAAQLQHPNIVALFEVSNYEGQPYFSM